MSWIKSHKLVIILVGIIVVLLGLSGGLSESLPSRTDLNLSKSLPAKPLSVSESAPVFDGSDQNTSGSRVVIKESTISLLVQDVVKAENQLISYAKENGGYMVNTSYSKQNDFPFAAVSVRVPTELLDQSLSFIRSLGIKVTDENIVGMDVTEDYTDIGARLSTLKQAQTKLQDLFTKASNAEDVLAAQRDLLDIQQQMDYLNGQKQSFEQNAEFTKITVYISTDELALPYTPDHAFRPDAIFKSAVRSMLSTLQFLGQLLIWLAVFSPLIALGILLYRFIKKFRNRAKTPVL